MATGTPPADDSAIQQDPSGHGCWDALPLHILDNVKMQLEQSETYDYEPSQALKNLRLVSRRWCAWATGAITCLVLPPTGHDSPTPLSEFGYGMLDMTSMLTPKDFGALCDSKAHPGAVNVGHALAPFTALKELSFARCNGTSDDCLRHLGTLSSLTKLDLCGCARVTAEGLTFLGQLTKLTNLNLGRCRSIGDGVLGHIAALPSLAKINLFGCVGVTDAGLSCLGAITSLTKLSLNNCSAITQGGMMCLGRLTSLTYLDLAWCRGINAGAISCLSPLVYLVELNCCGCGQITDSCARPLAALSSLTRVNLSYCPISDDGVGLLRSLLPALVHIRRDRRPGFRVCSRYWFSFRNSDPWCD
eukprot:evm.model.scf_860.1 EVM.evm.TU.scf_860.1   scf_860:5666-6939(-)